MYLDCDMDFLLSVRLIAVEDLKRNRYRYRYRCIDIDKDKIYININIDIDIYLLYSVEVSSGRSYTTIEVMLRSKLCYDRSYSTV